MNMRVIDIIGNKDVMLLVISVLIVSIIVFSIIFYLMGLRKSRSEDICQMFSKLSLDDQKDVSLRCAADFVSRLPFSTLIKLVRKHCYESTFDDIYDRVKYLYLKDRND